MQYFFDSNIIDKDFANWSKNINEFQNEVLNCNKKIWINWPEKELYGEDMTWKIIPICFCVPSDDNNNMVWIDQSRKFIPKIYDYIKSLKNVKTALISKMGKNTKLGYHQGWACVANHVLRCHLPILVEENKSGVVVDQHLQYHDLNSYILFDDSIRHYGFNYSENDRYVLIIDFPRPLNIQSGSSDIETSSELLRLSSSYKIINNVYEKLNI